MYGVINAICEVYNYDGMDGYKIKAASADVYVLIDNSQQCCEEWGYFANNDDFSYFIGAELKDVKLTNIALNEIKAEPLVRELNCGGIQFVDFVTSKGTFQLAVYNSHNGYYGHDILVKVGAQHLICTDL